LKDEGVGCLKQWFTTIRDWVNEDVCQTRRLWLEIVGVPIQIWNEHNIRKIAETWRDVVYVDKDTSEQASFSSIKVVIDTLSMNPIDDEAILQVEDEGYRVSTFEAKTQFTIIHTGPLNEEVSSSSMGIKSSQKVVVMDSSDDVAAQDGMVQRDMRRDPSYDDEQADEAVKESPTF